MGFWFCSVVALLDYFICVQHNIYDCKSYTKLLVTKVANS